MTDTIEMVIKLLPTIISYIAYGAVFLSIYRFMTFKDKKQEFTEFFFICATISFIIKTIGDIFLAVLRIEEYSSSSTYYACVLIITALLAYISARVSISKWFNSFLLCIGVQRTTNSTIWRDVIKNNTKVVVHLKDEDLAYVGYHKYTEDNRENPRIVLSHYSLVKLSTTEILVDYSNDSNRVIMLATDDIDAIEFIYKGR